MGMSSPHTQGRKEVEDDFREEWGRTTPRPQQSKWDKTDSTVPDTTKSLQEELMKLIKEQWELKQTLKEQQVQIEPPTRDLNKSQFEIARQQGLASLAQRNMRGPILKNIEFHKILNKIHQALNDPERVSEEEIFIASMT